MKMQNNSNTLNIKGTDKVRISLTDFNDEFTQIFIEENANVTIDFVNFKDLINVDIIQGNNSNCAVRFLLENNKKDVKMHALLNNNSNLEVFFADYTHGDTSVQSNVELLGEHAKTNFEFTTLGKNSEKKKYDISFDHKSNNTYSNFECFGVAMDESFLKINGISHIEKDMTKSETHQKVKVILFDETSRAIANPILKIDCDDIIASHACAIGSLNSNHIFYLLSRGLTIEEARKLITTGYLLPIKEKFDDEEKDKIIQYVEGDF